MSRIFLSHSSKDNFEAIALRDWLASEGWQDVFLDLDPERGIAAGQRWERALHDAASRCEAVIFVVSANWLASGWCTKEYALARGLNKKLFAVLTNSTQTIGSLPEELTGVWQIVDLVHAQDLRLFPVQMPGSVDERHVSYSRDGLLRLKRGLEKAGLDPKFFAWPPEGEPDRPPYRGLKPQEASDAGIFFGRDAPIVEAIDRLRGLRVAAPPRLMAILGASGSGKSSFLRAGLLPRLKRDDTQFIPLSVVRPERAALTGETGLVNALAAVLPAHSRADLRAAAQAGAGALRPLLAELVRATAARRAAGDESERPPAFVVPIDQAEELFRTEGREESESLLALLADLAAGDDPTVIVIFTIRSNSYDALQSARALEGLRQVAFSLPPMPRGAYQEVIEGPAHRVEEAGGKLAIEPALTERLLVDIEAGAGDALPLLAFTLEQLYLDYRQTGALRLADYERFGGVKGAINAAVERALVHADAEPRIPRDREARLALLRRGLIPWLAGVDPDSKTPRRNLARRSDIPPEAGSLIDLLVEERLLSVDTRVTRDPNTGEEVREKTIEPTHEALLRQWGLLDGWLKEDFGLLTTLEGVKRAARDWDANARGNSWLAHQGDRLAEAQALEARPDIASRLDATDRAYLDGCRVREAAARSEAEQRRREREEEETRRLADARKIIVRTRVGAGIALLFAIVAGAFAYYAVTEKTLADQKAKEAVSAKIEAVSAKNEAIAAKNDAVAAKTEAENQALKVIRNQSVALAAMAARESAASPVRAAKLALAGWPRGSDDRITPKLPAILDALGLIVPLLRERLSFKDVRRFAVFSPDGTRVLTGSMDNTARLWDATSGRALATLAGHLGTVNSAAFSPDGAHIVTASSDRTAMLWDSASGAALATLVGHQGAVISATFSPDGKRVATTSLDKTARLWDSASGSALTTLQGHEDYVISAAFSPDGMRIATASADNTARLWDPASGRVIAILEGHEAPVRSVTFSLDGAQIVTASSDRTARLWDGSSGRAVATLGEHKGPVLSAVFSPDGTRVVTASEDNLARVWDAASGRLIVAIRGHQGPVRSATFSSDGTRIVTASDDNTARLWDATFGTLVALLKGHDGPVVSAAFSQDATRVVTMSQDNTARVWDVGLGRTVAPLSEHSDFVNSAVFSPDGTRVLTASRDGTARLWNAASGQSVATLLGHKGGVRSAAFNPSGTRVVTASRDNTARVWDARSGQLIVAIEGHASPVVSASFSPTGARIVTASNDGTARVWDADSGGLVAVLEGHDGPVVSASFSPDGTRILTGSEDATARVWDAASGRAIATLEGHRGAITAACFSRDGVRILTASRDGTARLWDAATGNAIVTFTGHQGPILSAAFSSDGARIVTASMDKTAWVWDAASGHPLAKLAGHTDRVFSAAFSPDGTRIVTASRDWTAKLWDAATGRALANLAGHRNTVVSAQFSPDGTRIITASDDKTARVWDVSGVPKGNILQVACELLNGNFDLGGVTAYALAFDSPICATDPPPPDLAADPAASTATVK